MVMSQAVLIAIGIDWDGRRQILAVEMANTKTVHRGRTSSSACANAASTASSWSSPTIMQACARPSRERSCPTPPSSAATCTSLRNALDHLRARPTTTACKAACAGFTTAARSKRPTDLAAWIAKWGVRYPRLVAWVEETIEETLTFYRRMARRKHLESTNVLERLNEEIRRRTYVVQIFPNADDACRRLVRALAVETHENWLEAHRYINMNDLKEHKKIPLRQARMETQPTMTAFAELDAQNPWRPTSDVRRCVPRGRNGPDLFWNCAGAKSGG